MYVLLFLWLLIPVSDTFDSTIEVFVNQQILYDLQLPSEQESRVLASAEVTYGKRTVVCVRIPLNDRKGWELLPTVQILIRSVSKKIWLGFVRMSCGTKKSWRKHWK